MHRALNFSLSVQTLQNERKKSLLGTEMLKKQTNKKNFVCFHYYFYILPLQKDQFLNRKDTLLRATSS